MFLSCLLLPLPGGGTSTLGRKSWKRRYFKIDKVNNRLVYYENWETGDSKRIKVKGVIKIQGAIVRCAELTDRDTWESATVNSPSTIPSLLLLLLLQVPRSAEGAVAVLPRAGHGQARSLQAACRVGGGAALADELTRSLLHQVHSEARDSVCC